MPLPGKAPGRLPPSPTGSPRRTTTGRRMYRRHPAGGLVAGDTDLVGVDDDDEIAGIDVGRVDGLVLAAQTEGDFTGHPSEDLVGRVNHEPLMHHFGRFGAEGFHVEYGLEVQAPKMKALCLRSSDAVQIFEAELRLDVRLMHPSEPLLWIGGLSRTSQTKCGGIKALSRGADSGKADDDTTCGAAPQGVNRARTTAHPGKCPG